MKVVAADASLGVPFGHKDDPWSLPPRPGEIIVVVAMADEDGYATAAGSS